MISSFYHLLLWGDLSFSSVAESWHDEEGALTHMSLEALGREVPEDKDFVPFLLLSLFCQFAPLFYLEWALNGKIICLQTVLERTCKLTFNIKLAFQGTTAKDTVNFECFLSLTEAIYGETAAIYLKATQSVVFQIVTKWSNYHFMPQMRDLRFS